MLLAACGQNAGHAPDAGSVDAGHVVGRDAASAVDAAAVLDSPDARTGAADAAAGDPGDAAESASDAAAAPDADLPDAGGPDADTPDAAMPPGPDAGPAFTGCRADPPAGAALPAAYPVYAGTCPTLTTFPAELHLTSRGNDRLFKVVVPASREPGERFALAFVWHWLQGSVDDAASILQLQLAADRQRIIFVLPEPKGELLFQWPFSVLDGSDRIDEEVQFFDDLLACVAAAHPEINPGCITSLGISAGALFNDQLAPRRSERLANFVSLSGGVGNVAKGWDGAARHLPAVVLWGGDGDNYNGLYDFAQGSKKLEDELTGEGELFVECIHNCGHAVPPFLVSPGGTLFETMWEFALDHPYWIPQGTSPYQTKGLPLDFPDWCGMGKGSAAPRTDPSGC